MLALQPDPVQPSEGNDSNVIALAFGRKTTDGGKARITARRRLIFPQEGACDLSMREADTAPSETDPCAGYATPSRI
jgi:hypothetical protein